MARLAERSFAAVLLDCEMPGLDGRETCRVSAISRTVSQVVARGMAGLQLRLT